MKPVQSQIWTLDFSSEFQEEEWGVGIEKEQVVMNDGSKDTPDAVAMSRHGSKSVLGLMHQSV